MKMIDHWIGGKPTTGAAKRFGPCRPGDRATTR
jgi:hypothetical protein